MSESNVNKSEFDKKLEEAISKDSSFLYELVGCDCGEDKIVEDNNNELQ